MMSPNSESSQSKKRESRAGTRKVTSLSAEQLERKRANDREAQRTIRQRTKEHIERLEHQVAELKSKGEQYDDIVRRNAALENEIRALKHQLAIVAGGQGYSNLEGTYSNPSGSMIPSSQYSETLGVNPVSRAPSVLSTSSQVSVAHDWQPYSSTRSSSMGDSPDADYTNRVEPYIFEGQLQAPATIPVAPSHIAYSAASGGHPPDPTFQPYTHLYPPGGHGPGHPEAIPHNPPQAMQYGPPGQRSVSVPTAPPERETGGYPVLQAPQQPYQHAAPPGHPQRNQYNYDWAHRP